MMCVQIHQLEGRQQDSGTDRKEPGTSCWCSATHRRLKFEDLKQVLALDSNLGKFPWGG